MIDPSKYFAEGDYLMDQARKQIWKSQRGLYGKAKQSEFTGLSLRERAAIKLEQMEKQEEKRKQKLEKEERKKERDNIRQ